MKKFELFTFSISLIALAMSAAALYFEFFHVEHRVSVSSYDIINRERKSFADLAISNDGDRSIAITNLHFILTSDDVNSFEAAHNYTYVDTYVDGVYSNIVLSDAPLNIAAGDTVLVRLSSSFDFSDASDYYKESSFNIGIKFDVYTSTAKRRSLAIVPFWTRFFGGLPEYPGRGEEFESEKRKSWDL